MPLHTDDELSQLMGPSGEREEPVEQPEQGKSSTAMQGLLGGFASNNTLVGMAAHKELAPNVPLVFKEPIDLDYNPYDPEKMKGYEDHTSAFKRVNNDQQHQEMKRVVDFYRAAQADAEEHAITGSLGAMLGEAADPAIFVSGGAAIKAVKLSKRLVKGAIQGAGTAAAAEALQEAGQQLVDPTRSAQDSAEEIAAVALFGGFLGAGANAISKEARSEAVNFVKESLGKKPTTQKVVTESGEVRVDRSVSAAETQGSTISDTRLANINNNVAKMLSGPVEATRTPTIRTLTNEFDTARSVGDELFDHGMKMEYNLKGKSKGPKLENLLDQDRNATMKVVKQVSDIFVAYAGKNPEGFMAKTRAAISAKADKSKLSWRDFNKAVHRAVVNSKADVPAEVRKAADVIIADMEKVSQKLYKAGLLKEGELIGAERYFPRKYNKTFIRANRARFEALVFKHFANKDFADIQAGLVEAGLKSPADLQEAAQRTVDRILGDQITDHEFGHAFEVFDVLTKPSFTRSRALDIPDEELIDFLESDVTAIYSQYASQASRILRYKEWLGKRGWSRLSDAKAELAEEVAEKIKNGGDAVKLDKASKKAFEVIKMSAESVLGKMVQPGTHNSPWAKGLRAFRAYEAAAKLGGMTITALADLVRTPLRHGVLRTAWDGYGAEIRSAVSSVLSVKGKEARREIVEQLKDYSAGIELQNSKTLRALNDPDYTPEQESGILDAMVSASSEVLGRLSLMAYFNNFGKRVSAHTSQARTIRALDGWKKTGKMSEKEGARLAQLGIGADKYQKIVDNFHHIEKHNGSYISNVDNWADTEVKELFRAHVITDVEAAIVTPGKGDIPFALQSSEELKSIFQFKSFSAAATNKMLIQGIQDGNAARTAMYFASTAMAGYGTYVAKQLILGNEPSTDIEDMVKEGVTRSGMLGLFGDYIATLPPFGSVLGTTHMKYGGASIADKLAGPAVGTVSEVGKLMHKAASPEEEITESDTEAMKRMVPFHNLFWLKLIMRQAFGEDK